MNSITIVGNITADPEMTTTTTGKSVAKITIACDRSRAQDSKTDYIPLEAWEAIAENLHKNFRKGDFVKVTGILHLDTYEKDGVKRTKASVVVKTLAKIEKTEDAMEGEA